MTTWIKMSLVVAGSMLGGYGLGRGHAYLAQKAADAKAAEADRAARELAEAVKAAATQAQPGPRA